jgi:hypothetical protein
MKLIAAETPREDGIGSYNHESLAWPRGSATVTRAVCRCQVTSPFPACHVGKRPISPPRRIMADLVRLIYYYRL